MTVYEVKGGKRLEGSVNVQGAKNSVLPILAATLLIKDKCIIHNCPMLSDVEAALKILIKLGCVCIRDEDTVIVDATDAANYEIPNDLMREMRSSVLFLGAIVSRMGKAKISTPGGCELGPRPIDLHLSSLKQLGVVIKEENGYIECSTPNSINGTVISLPFPSVGATENIIIASCISGSTTVIKGAACEPEISDLADFLNSAGARIKGAGSKVVIIEGVLSLHSTEHTVIPDRIVASTFLSVAAITGGEVYLNNVRADYFSAVLRFFKNLGCTVKGNANSVYIKAENCLSRDLVVKTGVYPEFPTDAGSLIIPLLSVVKGNSKVIETIFENRFRFINELKKFSAEIDISGNTAYISGGNKLKGCNVSCTDLRGGAALVIAALNAEGITHISEIQHIERGYCELPAYLSLLGADIKEVELDVKENT